MVRDVEERAEVPALKAAVEKRMVELGLSPTDLARESGITLQGLQPLRQGRRKKYQTRLTREACRVLRWTPDSIERILDGRRPVRLPDPENGDMTTLGDELVELATEVRDLAGRVRELEDRFSTSDPTPPGGVSEPVQPSPRPSR